MTLLKMNISTTLLLCAILSIFSFNVYADKVYDTQQFADVSGLDSADSDIEAIQKQDAAWLYTPTCLNKTFTPKKDDVSQLRVLFPTKSLLEVWKNKNYRIGFRVLCELDKFDEHATGYNFNTNWYEIYQNKKKLDTSLKFTRFTMEVGKCKKDKSNLRTLTSVEILFGNTGSDLKHAISLKRSVPIGCERITNFKPWFISHFPKNSTDVDIDWTRLN